MNNLNLKLVIPNYISNRLILISLSTLLMNLEKKKGPSVYLTKQMLK